MGSLHTDIRRICRLLKTMTFMFFCYLAAMFSLWLWFNRNIIEGNGIQIHVLLVRVWAGPYTAWTWRKRRGTCLARNRNWKLSKPEQNCKIDNRTEPELEFIGSIPNSGQDSTPSIGVQEWPFFFYYRARQHLYAAARAYCPPVCPSVCHTGGSVRIRPYAIFTVR